MKKIIILLLLISSTTTFAQSITNKLGSTGIFLVTDADDSTRIQIAETGDVAWYLAGHDMVIRDRDFQSYGQYDYLNIDGGKGRIGFNILTTDLPLTSSIHLMGSIAKRVRVITSGDYDVLQDDNIIIINTSSNQTITLPTVDSCKGREYVFKRNNIKTGKVSITVQTGESINGTTNGEVELNTDNASVQVVCDGSEWWVLSELDVAPSTGIVTADVSATDDDIIEINFAESSANTVTITLPAVADYDEKEYIIKRNANGEEGTISNHVYIKPASGEFLDNINSSSSYDMANVFESVTIRSNGSRWLIISNYGH